MDHRGEASTSHWQIANWEQDIHVKCSNGSFSQPCGICNVSILSYLFRYSGLCCLRLRIYLAIKQSCSYDTNNWQHGQSTNRFIPEASNYTEHPEWDHYSNYPFVSHKFLVSEIVKMNGQESVNSYRRVWMGGSTCRLSVKIQLICR